MLRLRKNKVGNVVQKGGSTYKLTADLSQKELAHIKFVLGDSFVETVIEKEIPKEKKERVSFNLNGKAE